MFVSFEETKLYFKLVAFPLESVSNLMYGIKYSNWYSVGIKIIVVPSVSSNEGMKGGKVQEKTESFKSPAIKGGIAVIVN